ncbi:MAG: hypothetical protein ABW194_11530 [Novosphingobium sp.]
MRENLALRFAPRPAAPSLETLLDLAVGEIDELLAEVRTGVRDQRHFEALEERAAAIAAKIRGAFRARRR